MGNRRSKRSIPTLHFVGDVLGDVFGTLGSKFETKYANDISLVNKNEDHLLMLLKNHTSIMESSLNIIKQDESEIKKHTDAINSLTNVVELKANSLQFETKLNNFLTYLSNNQ